MSIDEFLAQVARRGSLVGGGSVVAVGAALAAALLEKLLIRPSQAASIRRIRKACLVLADQDAVVFSRVIAATRQQDRRRFTAALKRATDVPFAVFRHACTLRVAGKQAQRSINPKFHSDLRCALALADAAGVGARTLVLTNLAWLRDARYTRQMKRRLATVDRHAR